MKSNSAGPVLPWMSRFSAATEVWFCSISSPTIAGSADRAPRWRAVAAGRDSHRAGPDEVAPVEDRLQRVQGQRIGSPDHVQQCCATRRRGQTQRDVDEQPAAGLLHRRRRDQFRNIDSPSGFIASVIICWCPTDK